MLFPKYYTWKLLNYNLFLFFKINKKTIFNPNGCYLSLDDFNRVANNCLSFRAID